MIATRPLSIFSILIFLFSPNLKNAFTAENAEMVENFKAKEFSFSNPTEYNFLIWENWILILLWFSAFSAVSAVNCLSLRTTSPVR